MTINCKICTPGFTGFPLVATAYDTTYKLGDPSTSIAFTGLSNNQCNFTLELFESVAGVLQAIDGALFTYVAPVVSPDATKLDSYWSTVISDGTLTIYALAGTPNNTTYNMVLVMTSIANALDTATHQFPFTVTITLCS